MSIFFKSISLICTIIFSQVSYSQIFAPKNEITKGYQKSLEAGTSFGIDEYNYNTLHLEMINGYRVTRGSFIGLGAGINYSNALSMIERANGKNEYFLWKGTLFPIYGQLKFYFPFRSTFRKFIPFINLNFGHVLDFSKDKNSLILETITEEIEIISENSYEKILTVVREETSWSNNHGIILGINIGLEIPIKKWNSLYFLMGFNTKNNQSMYIYKESEKTMHFSPMDSFVLKIGINL